MNKKLIITVTVVLIIAMLGGGAYVLLGNKTSNDNVDSNNQKRVVDIKSVSSGDITKSITGKGTVETHALENVAAPAKCIINEMFVKVGAKISKGDKLFSMDENELSKEYENAKSELKTAIKEAGDTAPSYDYITVRAPKAAKVEKVNISKKTKLSEVLKDKSAIVLTDENGQAVELTVPHEGEVTSVKAKVGKKVKAGDVLFSLKVPSGEFDKKLIKIKEAQAKLDLLAKYLKDPIIYSEYDGIVNEVTANPSQEAIDNGTKVLSLQLQSGYMLSISITQDELESVKKGQEAEISFDSGYSLKGLVEHISYKADDNGQFKIVISLKEAEQSNEVYPGIKANASIILEKRENVLRVPIDAVKQDEKGDYVMIYTGEDENVTEVDISKIKMEKRYVERGLANAMFAEVKSGVKDGEKIVVAKSSGGDEGMYGQFSADMFSGNMEAIVIE